VIAVVKSDWVIVNNKPTPYNSGDEDGGEAADAG